MAYLNDKASSQNLITNLCFFFLSRLFGCRPLILPLPLQSALFIHANKKTLMFFLFSTARTAAHVQHKHKYSTCKIKLPLSSTKAKRCITHTLALNEEYRCAWRKGANTPTFSNQLLYFCWVKCKGAAMLQETFLFFICSARRLPPRMSRFFLVFRKRLETTCRAESTRPPSLIHAVVSLTRVSYFPLFM